MALVLYPVAATADQALSSPLGRAAREREARDLAGGEVRFVTEPAGPLFHSREDALSAFAGRGDAAAEGDGWLSVQRVAEGRPPAPLKPLREGPRRWPEPLAAPAAGWRAAVSYWRVGGEAAPAPVEQARRLRRRSDAPADPAVLRALARQPLRAVRPQQPLDLGLFEQRLPEAPDTVIPDE